LVAVTV
jgi:hypothetical protein